MAMLNNQMVDHFDEFHHTRDSFPVSLHPRLPVRPSPGIGYRIMLDAEMDPFFPDNPSAWVNYNELTTSSLEIIVSKGNHPLLWPVSELL